MWKRREALSVLFGARMGTLLSRHLHRLGRTLFVEDPAENDLADLVQGTRVPVKRLDGVRPALHGHLSPPQRTEPCCQGETPTVRRQGRSQTSREPGPYLAQERLLWSDERHPSPHSARGCTAQSPTRTR